MAGSLFSRIMVGSVWHLAILVFVPGSLVFAAVLPPAAGERLGAAFAELEPEWELEEATIVEEEVAARLCGADGCFELVLSQPGDGCSGTLLPAWCISFADDCPEALAKTVVDRFKRYSFRDFWQVPEKDKGGLGIDEEAGASPLSAYLLALALMLSSLLCGILLGGLLLRRLLGRRLTSVRGALVLLVPPLLPAFLLPMSWLFVGFYDLVLYGILVAVGMVFSGHSLGAKTGWREVALLVGAVAVSLLLLESGVRLLLPPPPAFPPSQDASFWLVPMGTADASGTACKSIFPAQYPELVQARARFPERPRRVLHVGDSMVEGVGVPRAERFVALLNGESAKVSHVNAGISGTGPAHYYLLTRHWTKLLKTNMVVWYLFPYNDFESGLVAKYGCCGGRSLLQFDGDGFAVACTAWEADERNTRFSISPAPYPLRVATGQLRLAGHLVSLLVRLTRPVPGPVVGEEESLRRTRLVLRRGGDELEEQGIRFAVVLLPFRGLLEGDTAVAPALARRRTSVLEICQDLQLDCYDGLAALAGLRGAEEISAAFINDPVWDYHFSGEGHRLLAEWLERELGGAWRSFDSPAPRSR